MDKQNRMLVSKLNQPINRIQIHYTMQKLKVTAYGFKSKQNNCDGLIALIQRKVAYLMRVNWNISRYRHGGTPITKLSNQIITPPNNNVYG